MPLTRSQQKEIAEVARKGLVSDFVAKGEIISPAQLGTGTPNATMVLMGDSAWTTLTASGDMLKSTYDPNVDGKIAEAELTLSYATHSNSLDHAEAHTHTGVYATNTDARLSDARIPTPHDSSYHTVGYSINTHVHTNVYAPLEVNTYVAPTKLGLSPTNSLFLRGDNTWQAPSGGSDPWTYIRLATEFRTPLATPANVTGLAFAPSANLKYEIEGSFYVKTATATVGPQPGCTWPTGMATGVAQVSVSISNTASVLGIGPLGATIKAIGTALPVANIYYPASLWAMMTAGATPTGNFQVILGSETNATNVFMGVDSFLKYRTYT